VEPGARGECDVHWRRGRATKRCYPPSGAALRWLRKRRRRL
jgi:hypothetical protein